MNDSQKMHIIRNIAAMRLDAMRIAEQAAELAAIYKRSARATEQDAGRMRAIEINASDAVKALERMTAILCRDPEPMIWNSFEPVMDAISTGLDCLGGLV